METGTGRKRIYIFDGKSSSLSCPACLVTGRKFWLRFVSRGKSEKDTVVVQGYKVRAEISILSVISALVSALPELFTETNLTF